MPTVLEAKTRMRQLAEQAHKVYDDPRMTVTTKARKLADLTDEMKDCRSVIDTNAQLGAVGLLNAGSALGPGELSPDMLPGLKGRRVAPVDFDEPVLKALYDAAAQHKSVRIETKAGADDLEAAIPVRLGPPVLRRIEPTRVASLIPAVATDAPVVEYPRIDSTTGSATVVAAGALKPSVSLNTSIVEARAQKIAGLMSVQDETLQDFPSFAQLVTAELQTAVIEAENAELLNGDGSTGHLDGLLHLAGITRTPGTGETDLDTLEQAITDLRTGSSFVPADAVVLNPADWSTIRRAKDGYGRYMVAPDPTKDAASSVFGVPVIETTTMPAGTALVGAFALGAMLHVRRGMLVEVNNRSDADWTHNTSTFRAELREALAVLRPSAFVKVTLAA